MRERKGKKYKGYAKKHPAYKALLSRCSTLIVKGKLDEPVLKRERVITRKRYSNARRY